MCASLFLTSCEDNPVKKVDVSGREINFRSHRFDHDLFGADFSQPLAARQLLYQKYGSFLCDYMEVILQVAPCMPDSNFVALESFVRYPDMVQLQREIDLRYNENSIAETNAAFKQAFTYWNHYFPDSIVPQVVYMNSGFNFSAFSTDSIVAVGLDFFLGASDSITQLLSPEMFPRYFKEDMEPKYLVANVVKDFCWHQVNKIPARNKEAELIELLVHQGKVMYLCDAMLPFAEDSIKMNWSTAQTEWALEHTYDVWKVLATDKVMFQRNFNENKKWIDFGPFTNVHNIPNSSPPQLGIWIGWNMVRQYMKEHPEVTLQQLLADQEYSKIVKAYKPERN